MKTSNCRHILLGHLSLYNKGLKLQEINIKKIVVMFQSINTYGQCTDTWKQVESRSNRSGFSFH